MGRRRNSVSRRSTGISMKKSAATAGSSRSRTATSWSQSSWARSVRTLCAGGPVICLSPHCLPNHRDLNIPFAANHIDSHVAFLPHQQQIDGGPTHSQVVNPQFTKRSGQVGTGEAYPLVDTADLEAKAGPSSGRGGGRGSRQSGLRQRLWGQAATSFARVCESPLAKSVTSCPILTNSPVR